MNKILFILFLLLLLLCLTNKNEGMRNPLTPPEYEFSILTSPQDIMSGYFQAELCRSDPKWNSGDMKCQHILNKDDCSLVGYDGKLANDACLIECDTCPMSVTIKKRQDVGDELSVRGINFEDNDEYNYLEIFDSIQNINEDINTVKDKIDDVQKQGGYLDLGQCTDCFYKDGESNIDYMAPLSGNDYLDSCPNECRSFANCFLDSTKSPDMVCDLDYNN